MTDCQHDSLSRTIYLTSQAMRHHVDRMLRPFDITTEQLHILKIIERQITATQREICGTAGKSPANTTRILDRLEKKQLIVRRDNPIDRRSQLVSLTPGGQDLAGQLSDLFAALSDKIEKNIDKDEAEIVKQVLGRIQQNLVALSEDPGD